METYSLILGVLGLFVYFGGLVFIGALDAAAFTIAFFGGVALTLLGYEMATEKRARWVLYRVGLAAGVVFAAGVATRSADAYFAGPQWAQRAQLQTAMEICASDLDRRGKPLRMEHVAARTGPGGRLQGAFICSDGSRHSLPVN